MTDRPGVVPVEDRGTETRRRIVEAVWNVIAERGLSALTTRLVAKEAGISHGMTHYYFETKDDLVLAVVQYARHYWIDPMERLVDRPGAPHERLEAVIEWMAEPATREVMRVHQELLSHSEWNERLRAAMAAEYGRWWAAYVRLFRELAEAGRLTAGTDVDVLGIAFATLSDGLVSQRSLDPGLDTEAIMRGFLAPFLVTDRQGPG